MGHSSYISTYRLDNYSPRLHLSIYAPAVAASGTLTATPVNPTTSLAVSFAVGDEGDVLAGFLVRITDTATGKVKGYTRVRYYGTPTSSSIPVRELSFAHCACASGDTFEVLRFVPLDTKLVEADAAFNPDGIPYASQGSNPPPLACSGGNSVGWVDSGQTFRTITTDGSHSSTVDPDSAGDPDHFWINDGSNTAFASGSANTDASPVIEANVGSWLLQHNAFDPDTSQPVTQFTHHITHDADHPPYECVLTDYNGDYQNGINWTVEIVDGDVSEDTLYPLALCFLWVDDVFTHTGAQDMHRSEVTGRSHIIGMGYARRVTTTMDGEDGVEHVSVEIQSPLARLQEIASYSKVMLEAASPDEWNEIKTLGFRRGITQLVQFYTTLVEAGCDFVYDASFVDARYPAHFIQRSDPIGQIRELVDARNGRLVQREWGARFEVQYDLALLPLDDRTADDLTLTTADVYGFDAPQELGDVTELFELQGVTAGTSGNAPVFSRVGVGGGKNADTVARKSPDNQTQANAWAGMVYAMRENVYQDEDGIRCRVGELTLRCPGQYMVLDFSPEYVRFTYSGRRTDFSAFRFWLKRFTFDMDANGGEGVTTFVLQTETAAREGVTYTPEGSVNTGSDKPRTPPLPGMPTDGLNWGTKRLATFQADNTIRYTSTANRSAAQGGAIWLAHSHATDTAGWHSGDDQKSGVQKAFFPRDGWIVSDTRIYLAEGLPTPSVTAQHTFGYAWNASSVRFIQTERCHPAWAMCPTWEAAAGQMKVAETIDGASWSEVNVGSTGSGSPSAFVWMSGHTPGKARIGTFNASGGISIFEKAGFGASWTELVQIVAANATLPTRIEVPYADESIMYVCLGVNDGSSIKLRIYQVVGTDVDEVTPSYLSDTYGAGDWMGLRSWDGDARALVLAGIYDNMDTAKRGAVFTSRSGVAGLTNVIPPESNGANFRAQCWIGGDRTLYVAGWAGHFYVARNLLADGVLDDRTGTGFGTARALNLFGWQP